LPVDEIPPHARGCRHADLKHLERIVTGVRKIPGVRDVQRMQKI
jgi:hypothetical protein